MKTCFLFPGQGAQYAGMGKDFYETSKAVRALFELASDSAKMDLKKLVFEGSEEDLKQTQNTQIAMAVVEAAAALSSREHAVIPLACAGFSVGEWPALAEAGVLTHADMFRLVAERGRLMEEAGKRSGGSTMSAILNLAPDAIEAAIKEAGLANVWVANYNSPSQSVISGTEADVAAAEIACKAAGAKRAIRLKVSGAFHSPIMAYAYEGFKELLIDVKFSDPKLEVFSNVTGKKISSGAEAKRLAAEQIISPVRWIDEEKSIAAAGYDQCFEIGPGKVLTGLWDAINPDIACAPLGTLALVAGISL